MSQVRMPARHYDIDRPVRNDFFAELCAHLLVCAKYDEIICHSSLPIFCVYKAVRKGGGRVRGTHHYATKKK